MSWFQTIVQLLLGVVCIGLSLQMVLSDALAAGGLMSNALWREIVSLLGGRVTGVAVDGMVAEEWLLGLWIASFSGALICWVAGAYVISLRTGLRLRDVLIEWGYRCSLWWFLPGIWVALCTVALLTGLEGVQTFLTSTVPLWYAVTLAGWLATLVTMAAGPTAAADLSTDFDDGRVAKRVWLAVVLYVVVYTTMNWQLYRGLLVPHGDSAMYEEHLWNVEHGKGFRSYLDPGSFLGEHVQVVHLAIIPLHLAWPSQMLLELCESLALALGAIPVFWMTRRHTGSSNAGVWLAIAYLLYFPLQFLDIAIDLKTFRPIGFGVPLLLFAIDQMERRRYVGMSVLLLLTLTAKEDYCVVIAPLGLWLLFCSGSGKSERGAAAPVCAESHGKRPAAWGGGIALFSVGYLLLVLLVLIPAFREGRDPHYTGYFAWLGDSPVEIAKSMIAQPSVWLKRLFSVRSLLYVLAMLVPVGFAALLSLRRLAVGLPLFGALCLMELSAREAADAGFPLVPFHHFHAPLVPIVFWASAAGLKNLGTTWQGIRNRLWRGNASAENTAAIESQTPVMPAARFVCWSALASGLFFSLSPLGIPFWDFGSQWHWREIYVPGERAARFSHVLDLIPLSARVASTDFVHPRFTHHERSYDYSLYARRVSGGKLRVPPDTDFIVIDTQHRYSEIKHPQDMREIRDEPDRWQLLWDDGYFIVLKRK